MQRVSVRRFAALMAALTVVLLAKPVPVSARGHDARAERERVRRERAQVAAQLDVLRADSAEVEQALAALDERVAHEQAALASAQQALDAATDRAAEAGAREAAAAAEIDALADAMRDAAIEEFMSGGRRDLDAVLNAEGGDLRELASRQALLDVVNATAADTADALEAAREDHAIAREEAEAAAARAEAARSTADARLAQVRGARAQQAAFAADVDQRIERRLSEAASLETLDRDLAARIAREQEALARRTAGIARGPIRSVGSRGNVPLATVRGITVHADIAEELGALLEAADADGYSLGGGGYRDPEQQRRLREQNCPDPERSPASSCRPPTARPGQSMHEQGLAIDFTWNGRLITSRSSPAFRWLSQNAGRFGLRNLPEEPWHWSTNGR